MEYIDLKRQYQVLKQDINEVVIKCMENADFIMGEAVEQFEEALAQYVGVEYAISCGSGTDALQLIYMAYGIGRGDAVFCPAMTFVASIEPACLLGATPVFCEIEEGSYNISPKSLERQIKHVLSEGNLTPKAVVAVDFLGNPADYSKLKEISSKYNLILIEDAAQSIGGTYFGKKCGCLGDIAATSFFPSKPLGAYGDGGAVLTNNAKIAEKICSLRIHGKGETKYDNVRVGINSRLDTIQAEILKIKLKYLEKELQFRQAAAQRYSDELPECVHALQTAEGIQSAYAQYVILPEPKIDRKQFMNYLKAKDIPTIIYYPNALPHLPVFKSVNTYGESYKVAEDYSKRNVGIPFSPYIQKDEAYIVINTIKDYLKCMGGAR